MELANAISILALFAAGVLGIYQVRLQRRVTRIEENRRQEEIELRRRADVTALVEREQNSRGKQVTILKIRNLGPAPARNVSFEIEGIEGDPPVVVYESVKLPIPLLDPGGKWRVALEPMHGVGPTMKISLHWQDAEGSKNKELILNVF